MSCSSILNLLDPELDHSLTGPCIFLSRANHRGRILFFHFKDHATILPTLKHHQLWELEAIGPDTKENSNPLLFLTLSYDRYRILLSGFQNLVLSASDMKISEMRLFESRLEVLTWKKMLKIGNVITRVADLDIGRFASCSRIGSEADIKDLNMGHDTN